ncbi:MAG: hypothetical protein CFE45_03520 [Burkholderiales bacterium PBB5]|nr:MAG: hypothetical protein CFE45_03520 [Burkholderiales bacterium PBB5]
MTHTARHMGYRAGWWRDQLLRPWLRAVRGWVVIQPEQATALARTWGSRAPVHVLPNLARVDGPAPPTPAPAADGRLRVAVVGRLALQQKGLDWLARLLAQGPDWAGQCQWHFQGNGPGAPVLQALVRQLGPDQARLVPHAPLDEALAANDVLLLPSRYEGLPLVALEATARGWPVVASRQAGLGALLPARSQFEFGDAAGLAHALDSLRCPQARARAVAHARQRHEAMCGPRRYLATLLPLAQSLAGRPLALAPEVQTTGPGSGAR